MLAMGKNDSQIARALIEAEYVTGVKESTVLRNVNRWRKGKGQKAVLKMVADKMLTTTGRPKKHIDTVEELEDLVRKQKKRLEAALEKESQTNGLLLGMVTDEIKVLTGILVQLGKQQMEMGVRRKMPAGKIEADFEDEPVDAEFDEANPFDEEDVKLLELIASEMPIIEVQAKKVAS